MVRRGSGYLAGRSAKWTRNGVLRLKHLQISVTPRPQFFRRHIYEVLDVDRRDTAFSPGIDAIDALHAVHLPFSITGAPPLLVRITRYALYVLPSATLSMPEHLWRSDVR